LCVVGLALVACGDQQDRPQPVAVSDPGVVHVHGLGRNPADGSLMIATHTGLFRVAAKAGQPNRVAGRYQDTMGFTVVGPDHFLGSGHPGNLRKDPPFLGLIESRDAGNTWRPISLRGQVDFHVLEASGPTVYGFGSDFQTREARFLRSDDGGGTWTRVSAPEPLLSLAIDPADRQHIVALGEERGYVSRDGGSRWRPLSVPGGLVTWSRDLGLVALDAAGVVRRAVQPIAAWAEVGGLNGPPAAVEAVGDELLAARHDSVVMSSRDGGRTWRALLER
jgi:hypothetical protein